MKKKAFLFATDVVNALGELGNAEALMEFNEIQKTLFAFMKKVDWNAKPTPAVLIDMTSCVELVRESGLFTDIEYDKETGISCKMKSNGTPITFGPIKTTTTV